MTFERAENRKAMCDFFAEKNPNKEDTYRYGKFIEEMVKGEGEDWTVEDFTRLPVAEQEKQVNILIQQKKLPRHVRGALRLAFDNDIFPEKASRLPVEADQELVFSLRGILTERKIPSGRRNKMVSDLRLILRKLEEKNFTGADIYGADHAQREEILRQLVTSKPAIRKFRSYSKLIDLAKSEDLETASLITAEVIQEQSQEMMRAEYDGQSQPEDMATAQILLDLWGQWSGEQAHLTP